MSTKKDAERFRIMQSQFSVLYTVNKNITENRTWGAFAGLGWLPTAN